jgi:hypothetical protein
LRGQEGRDEAMTRSEELLRADREQQETDQAQLREYDTTEE